MRIGIDCRTIINPEKGDTGIGHYTYYLVKNLISIDKENQYILFSDQPQTLQEFSQPNVKLRFFSFGKFKKYLPFFYNHFLVPNWIKKEGCDLVHFPANVMPFFYKGNSILTIHDLSMYINPEWFSKLPFFFTKVLLPRSIKKADKIIAVSKTTKNDLIKVFDIPEKKIEAIWEGVELSQEKSKGENKFGRYLLFIGTLEPRKNIVSIIKAFGKVIDKYPDLNLLIAGKKGWKYQNIFEAIKEANLENKIKYLGYVSSTEKRCLLENAVCFIFPSLYEGFGLPVLESFSAGCPVVASQNTSMEEFASDAALLVDPADVNQLAAAIDKLLSDVELKNELIEKGYKKAQELTWTNTAKKTLELYLNT